MAASSSFICDLAHKITDRDNKLREMHIPGLLVPADIYSFMGFAFTVFFITLGFLFIMQCQCTDFANEEDPLFNTQGYLEGQLPYVNHLDRDRDRDRDRDSDKNTDTDRYSTTDTDTDTDQDYYPIGPIPSAPPVRDFCSVCGDWSTKRCSRCKVARYCSDACQNKHREEGHKLVCKEYTSPGNIGSAGAGSSEGRSSRHRVDGVPTRSKRKSCEGHQSVVQCPICFDTICTCCPSPSCARCNKKFHSRCISQWFLTSQKSICPCCNCPFLPARRATGQSSSSSRS